MLKLWHNIRCMLGSIHCKMNLLHVIQLFCDLTCGTWQKKKVDELRQKHRKDPISVRIWVWKNLDSIFYYVEHAVLDLNIPIQDDTPFTLGIQTTWQCEMMSKYGQANAIAFDTTFGTNQCKVWQCFPFCEIIDNFQMFYNFQAINHGLCFL